MNAQASRKIIVAGGMAAVVGIGVVTFALRSHPVAPVAQTPLPPARVAQIPDAPAELTTTPATSSSPADEQKVGTSTEFAPSDSQITPK